MKFFLGLLCGVLLLTACGISEADQQATKVIAEITKVAADAEANAPDDETPEQALNYYITACDAGDTVSARDVVAVRFSKPCQPEGSISSAQVGEMEISGKTARVQWEWMLPEGASEKHLLTLGLESNGWRLMGMDKVDKVWFEKEVVEIEPEIEEQFDANLPSEIIYLVQEGVKGEKNVTMKRTTTWVDGTGTTDSEVALEEIITEAVPMIVIVGQKSEADMTDELVGLVEDYFTSYQAGEYENLLALAPEAASVDYAKVSEIAEFEITSFEVSEPSGIGVIKPTTQEDFEWANKDRRYDYSNEELVVEPFVMQVEVPVKLSYKLFGIEFDSSGKFILRSSEDFLGWTMPFWGVTGASQVGEQVTLKDLTITLDGVATTHNATIVVLTADQSAQVIAVGIGERSEYASCKSGRCSVRFREFAAPDAFTLLLESGIIGFGSESHEFEIDLIK